MPVKRPLRRLLACLTGMCVVFAHAVALASGCAIEWERSTPQTVASPCAEHAGGSKAPAGNANACEVHCQAFTPTSPDAGLHVPAPVASIAPLALRAVADASFDAPPPLPRGAPPPVLRLTSRLLI